MAYDPEINNRWHHYSESDTVIVFLHGVLSDSRGCWCSKGGEGQDEKEAFWPDLVRKDPRFGDVSVYLAGYYTDYDSGPYEVADCADEVFGRMEVESADGRPPVLSKRNIVFVAHSTGGIVARYLINEHIDELEDKRIGLVLMASPSYGSKLANLARPVAWLLKQDQVRQLEWRSWSAKETDRKFRLLIEGKKLRELYGAEAFENHFVIHSRWLPVFRKTLVVTEESMGKYFGPPVRIPDTDHFTIVKPPGLSHHSHHFLFRFVVKHQLLPVEETVAKTAPSSPRPTASETQTTAAAEIDRGQKELDRGQLDKAFCSFERALVLFEDQDDARGQARASLGLGRVHRAAGRLEIALEGLARARELASGLDNADSGLGEVHLEICRIERDRSNYDAALDETTRAIDAFDRAGEPDGKARALIERGAVYISSGRRERAPACFDEAEKLLDAEEDAPVLARVALARAGFWLLANEYDKAEREYETARRQFEAADNRRGQIEVLLGRSEIERLTGNDRRATDLAERALEKSRDSELPLAEGRVHMLLGALHLVRGETNAAEEEYRTGLRLASRVGSPLLEANLQFGLASAREVRGELEKAHEDYEAAARKYRELNNFLGEANALTGAGNVEFLRGRWDEAEAKLATARSLYERISDRLGQANCALLFGEIHAARGNVRKARRFLAGASKLYKAVQQELGQANVELCLGRLEQQFGSQAGARECFAGALRINEKIDHGEGRAETLRSLAELDLNDPERLGTAQERLDQALAVLEASGNELGAARVRLARSALELARGNQNEAERLAADAERTFAAKGAPFGRAEALEVLAKTLIARDDPSGRQKMAEAASLFERLGAVHRARTLRRML